MQELYLIRHGQAGLRSDYDRLSDLGHQQASRLSEWFREQGIQFDLVLSGGLRRQRETAAALSSNATAAPEWNEFDLDAVYASIAPQLAAVDDAFRQEFESMSAAAADPAHPVHRAWRPSDLQVVKAWIEGRFPVDCETWPAFHERILNAFSSLDAKSEVQRIALVSSATPIGISTAKIFDAPVRQIFELAGSLHNASFTIFKKRPTGWSLSGFNHTPHLGEEKLRTFR
ncbi:MAG: histidine phosphatase family protein [Acidobacteria bacterium]|nr:histidine phosphatase family protein [Acidobacteriota bacterium]